MIIVPGVVIAKCRLPMTAIQCGNAGVCARHESDWEGGWAVLIIALGGEGGWCQHHSTQRPCQPQRPHAAGNHTTPCLYPLYCSHILLVWVIWKFQGNFSLGSFWHQSSWFLGTTCHPLADKAKWARPD